MSPLTNYSYFYAKNNPKNRTSVANNDSIAYRIC